MALIRAAFSTALTTAALVLLSSPVIAQEHSAHAPIQVTVEQAGGHEEIRGLLVHLGPQTATLLVGQDRRQFQLDDIVRISAKGDSVKNGAIIGGIVGGAWCALICGQGLTGAGQMSAAIAANAGLFALIGAGIDAAKSGYTPIYQRPRHVTASGPTLSLRWRF